MTIWINRKRPQSFSFVSSLITYYNSCSKQVLRKNSHRLFEGCAWTPIFNAILIFLMVWRKLTKENERKFDFCIDSGHKTILRAKVLCPVHGNVFVNRANWFRQRETHCSLTLFLKRLILRWTQLWKEALKPSQKNFFWYFKCFIHFIGRRKLTWDVIKSSATFNLYIYTKWIRSALM